MGRLSGTSAIVTGGARGIGGATARRLGGDGSNVLIVDVEENTANSNAERIRSAGGNAVAMTGDVASEEVAQEMVERAVSEFGRLDILVQNAYGGNSDREGSAVDVSQAAWREGMDLLTGALFLGAKYAVPAMESSGGGRIVNISSVHGLLMSRGSLVYEAGKSAVIGMTRQMAWRFRSTGNHGQRDSSGPHRHGTQRTNVETKRQRRRVPLVRTPVPGQAHRRAGRHRKRNRVPVFGRGIVYHRSRTTGRRRLVHPNSKKTWSGS